MRRNAIRDSEFSDMTRRFEIDQPEEMPSTGRRAATKA